MSVVQGIRRWLQDKLPILIVFFLTLIFLFLLLFPRVIIPIGSGEAGILYRRLGHGTITDYVFPEGIHLIFPWDIMYIYNVRVQTVLHELDVLTSKGLPIHLSLAIRFYPEYDMLGVLHQRVGPDYVSKIVVPQVESVLRKNLGNYQPEDIYTNKEGIITSIVMRALEETGQKYVHVDEVIIRKMELPEPIRQAIEEKLVNEQQAKAYEFKLIKEQNEAERKRVEAEGIRVYQDIIAQTLSDKLLTWQGIQASLDLAKSNNTKVVVIGNKEGLPLFLGGGGTDK